MGMPIESPQGDATQPNDCYGEFASRLAPIIDDTIDKLRLTTFREDPIAGLQYSRSTSIISSAYKRHNHILENAILERLKDCSRLRVWREDNFKLSHESLIMRRKHDYMGPCLRTELPYGDCERPILVDMMVFDTETRILRSYNVKRGNGNYDGGKRRIILDDLLRTHMLLRSYASAIGLDASGAHAHIIFY